MRRFAPSRRALAATAAAGALIASSVTHALGADPWVVRPGDTLWDIAHRHGTTVAELAALNHIADPSLILVGQPIRLTPAGATAPSPPPPAGPFDPRVHVVRPGDTLWGLAIRYQTSVEELATLNGIADPSFIRIGQVLRIPDPPVLSTPALAVPTAPPTPRPAVVDPVVHVVVRGDTLWAIASRYGTSVEALAALNGIADPSFIRTGMRLLIPGPAAAPAPSSPGMSPQMAAQVAQRAAVGDLLRRAASEFGVPAPLVLAVAWHESGWQTDVVSTAGAVGVMQLMPDTADWVAGSMLHEAPAIGNPTWNIRAGVRLLAFYLDRYEGERSMVLAAYLQGMTSADVNGILTSSRPYIDNVLALEALFGR